MESKNVLVFFILTILLTISILSIFYSNSGNVSYVYAQGNLGVYWDETCTSPVTFINWGILSPGSSRTVSVYIRNEGLSPFFVSVSTSDWKPFYASSYMNLESSCTEQVNAGEVKLSKFTLKVSPNIQNVKDFSFNIQVGAEPQKLPPLSPQITILISVSLLLWLYIVTRRKRIKRLLI